jgi:hypothetical protein
MGGRGWRKVPESLPREVRAPWRRSGPRVQVVGRSRSALSSSSSSSGRPPRQVAETRRRRWRRGLPTSGRCARDWQPFVLEPDRGSYHRFLRHFRGSGQEGRAGASQPGKQRHNQLVEEGRMAWAPSELGCISSRNRLAALARVGAQGEVSPTRRAHGGRVVGWIRESGLRERAAAGGEGALGGCSREASASRASPPTSHPTDVPDARAAGSIARRTQS